MYSNFICFESVVGSQYYGRGLSRSFSRDHVSPGPRDFFISLCFRECLLVSVLIHGHVSVKNQAAGEPGAIVSVCHSSVLGGDSDVCRGEKDREEGRGRR